MLLSNVASFKYMREPETETGAGSKVSQQLSPGQVRDSQLSSTCLVTSSSAGKTWLMGAKKVWKEEKIQTHT